MIGFTQTQIAEILALRRSGATQRELGRQFYCSAPTIGRVLRANGISGPHGQRKNGLIAMIQHDWNAGISTGSIARKYQLGMQALYSVVKRYRMRGWKFRARRKGAAERVRPAM